MNKYFQIVDKISKDPMYLDRMHTENTNKIVSSIICSLYENKNFDYQNIEEKVKRINNYILSTVKERAQYGEYEYGDDLEFDEDEMIYRTAYAAFVKREAMSVGVAEAISILLEVENIENKTILYTLDNKILNYAVVVKNNNNKYFVIAPLLEQSCNRNMWDYNEILNKATYILPNNSFFENKVFPNGYGINAKELLNKENIKFVNGKDNICKLFEV